MSSPRQPDVQMVYQQYQNILRQLQFYEQQETILVNQVEQYQVNLQTIEGLQNHPDAGEFIFPLSDVVLLKANLSGIKEVLVDIGSDYLLPSTLEKAEEAINNKIGQIKEVLERIQSEKQQLETLASQLQGQLSTLSQS